MFVVGENLKKPECLVSAAHDAKSEDENSQSQDKAQTNNCV